jgi:hypothetical protein
VCLTAEWAKCFSDIRVTLLKKKPKATKCSEYRTTSLLALTAEILVRILTRRFERKIENGLGKDQFGYRR